MYPAKFWSHKAQGTPREGGRVGVPGTEVRNPAMSFYLIFALGITLGFIAGVIATLALIYMYESGTWEDEEPYHRA